MATTIRSELSKSNQYYISKHKYYELKHFCLQYDEWKDEINHANFGLRSIRTDHNSLHRITDTTSTIAIKYLSLYRKIEMIEHTVSITDSELSHYIFLSVTKGLTFENLQFKYNIPCSRGTFYDRYRKFFWLLSQLR